MRKFLVWSFVAYVVLVVVIGDHEQMSARYFVDDTFYYLNTSWNAAKFGFVSFDLINPTNGFHFFGLPFCILWHSWLRQRQPLLT